MLSGLLISVALCSCAHEFLRPASDRYKLNVLDNVEKHRFEVSLQSSDDRALCVSVENWPNPSGRFSVEKEDVFLQIGNDWIPVNSPLMSAYCPGGCGELRIEPHGHIEGFISYEVFGDVKVIEGALTKQLNFPIAPYYCH